MLGSSAFSLIVLAYNISRFRVGLKIARAMGATQKMSRAIRAHANLTENAPLALILLAAVEAQGFSTIVLHALGITLVIGRVMHAYGSIRMPAPRSDAPAASCSPG